MLKMGNVTVVMDERNTPRNVTVMMDKRNTPRMSLELREDPFTETKYMELVIMGDELDVTLCMTEEQGLSFAKLHNIEIKKLTWTFTEKG